MKITLETPYGIFSIESKADDATAPAVRDTLLIPLLLAAGYTSKTVNDLFFDEDEQ